MCRRKSALVAGVFSIALAVGADAQTSPEPQSKRICFRGRPAAACRAFWLTEGGYYWRLAGSGFVEEYATASFERQHLGTHLAWEIGGMVNRGAANAIGGTLLIGYDSRGARAGVKGRYRRWLGRADGTLDLSAGLLKAVASGSYPDFSVDSYGPTAEVSIGWADLVAATARADVLYTGRGRVVNALYGGVRVGSYPAVVGTAALATYAAIIVIAFLGAGDF